MTPARDDLFERARAAADIEAVAGVKLYRAGRRLRGGCPLCGASEGKKAGGAFSVDVEAKVFKCFACDAGGDVIELEKRLGGGGLREAAERLAGAAPFAPRAPTPARPARDAAGEDARARQWKARTATGLWREAAPAGGSPVEAYLRGRGIDGPVLDAALARLRFHPAAYHAGTVRLPAMVGLVTTAGERGAKATGGVHVTYLAPGGRGKAAVTPAKRMWGEQVRDGRPGGVWLSPIRGEEPLIVSEGIESGLSAAMLIGGPCRVLAALSLRALQGGWRGDDWGRVDPDCPAADPEKPALTWPPAQIGPGEVLLAVDRDMSPINVKCRRATGGTWTRAIDAEARARICAALAEQHWRAAGAARVRAIGPGMGRDFNDELAARASGRPTVSGVTA